MVQNSILVNRTRKEFITFGGLSKRGEIMGSTLQSKMVVAHLFAYQGDHLFFIMSDWQTWSPYARIHERTQKQVFETYKDVTLELLEYMVEMGDIEKVPSWVQGHSPLSTTTGNEK